jgi:hypothetical protein
MTNYSIQGPAEMQGFFVLAIKIHENESCRQYSENVKRLAVGIISFYCLINL